MKNSKIPDEETYLGFAFARFFEKKYPVHVDVRVYTAEYNGILHNHDYPQAWYCLSGNYFHCVGDQVYECAEGAVIIVPTGVFHKFRVREREEVKLISVSVMYDIFLDVPYHRYLNAIWALFLPSFFKELDHAQPVCRMLSRASQKRFEECISWLSLLDYTGPGSVTKLNIQKKLEEMFSLPELSLPEACKQKAAQLVQNRLYQMLQALSYLNTHYYEKLPEEEILRKVCISHTNFYNFFKCYTGYTYSQYLQILRAKHVHIYLSRTNYPIGYISDVCGFCNTQHMSRIYKKYCGKTPREFRVSKKRKRERVPDEPDTLKSC